MRTEGNQLSSVGRLHIWSLSDALPEKEAFQSAHIYRDGVAKPILAETLDRFISQQLDLPMSGDESPCGMFMWFAKALSNKCKALHIVTGVTGKSRSGYYYHFLG